MSDDLEKLFEEAQRKRKEAQDQYSQEEQDHLSVQSLRTRLESLIRKDALEELAAEFELIDQLPVVVFEARGQRFLMRPDIANTWVLRPFNDPNIQLERVWEGSDFERDVLAALADATKASKPAA